MRASLFQYGFRPFFLFAGVAAAVLVPVWAADFVFGSGFPSGWPPTLWHAHEMLFGFIVCAVAGFLLTAVPSWTGRKGFAGWPLLALTLLWILGRIFVSTARFWPPLWVALIDVAFVPALALYILSPLLRAKNRNTPLLAILATLALANAAFHAALMRHDPPLALRALVAGIDVMLVLVTVIGGRIVPAFTASGLRESGNSPVLASPVALTRATVVAMVAVLGTDVAGLGPIPTGVVAAAAAVLHLIRLAGWRPYATRGIPLVWVLHVAYAWLPIGLGLKAIAFLSGAAFAAFWMHALTIGALSMMIVAVMTRAALGHTGRELRAGPAAVAAYVLLTLAVLTRVFGLSLLRAPYPYLILVSATLWTAAFASYLWVYAPILCTPRLDGRPG